MLPSGFGLAELGLRLSFLSNPGFSNGHAGSCLPGFSSSSFSISFMAILEEKRICLPSGLHRGVPAPYLYFVSWIASPPSSDKRNICGLPSASLTKASCLPSGLHTACEDPSLVVNCFGAEEPSVATIHTWFTYL